MAQLADADEPGVGELFQAEVAARLPEGWELSSMGTAVPSSGAAGGGGGGEAQGGIAVDGGVWAPAVGDRVAVKRLGTRPATVVDIGSDGWVQARTRCCHPPSARGSAAPLIDSQPTSRATPAVQIRLGQMVTRVALAELTPFGGEGDEQAARKPASQALLEKCAAALSSPPSLAAEVYAWRHVATECCLPGLPPPRGCPGA